MPPLGFGLDPKDAAATLDAAELLKQARPHHVVCALDPGRGHGRSALEQAVAVGRALGARTLARSGGEERRGLRR
jgi:hypothetical protein